MQTQAKNEAPIKQLHPPRMSDAEIKHVLDKASRQIFLSELVNEKVAIALFDLLFVFDNRRELVMDLIDDLYRYTVISDDAEIFDKEQREQYFLVYTRLQGLLRATDGITLKNPRLNK